MYKVKTFGWRNNTLDQISRIDNGLQSIGCKIVNENPDIIYSNNDMYDDILAYANEQEKKPFIILNVLDLQIGNPSYDLNKVENQLKQADLITCISQTVQEQIFNSINLKAHIIYNPVKDIFYNEEIKKTIPFLYVGRANDVRKRFSLIKDTFIHYPEFIENLIICGSENPNFGKYIGIISDDQLNILYNSSKFLLFPSKFEGLGLPMVEAMIAGCIPITCDDNPTAIEFCPKEFICQPNPESFIQKMIEINKNYLYYQNICLEYGKKYKEIMNKETIAKNIISLYNQYKR